MHLRSGPLPFYLPVILSFGVTVIPLSFDPDIRYPTYTLAEN
jgi:hypothetical protein